MNFIKYNVLTSIALIFAVGVTACNKPGPAESTGKKIDETTEKAGEVISDSAITAKVKPLFLPNPASALSRLASTLYRA